jgi:adenine-specific DNA methylase
MNRKSFIEVQFPVSKVSKESYKERKANLGQTLTGLGKWWGRKPLILVRAAILGLLMPASDDQKKDMEIFLKIMTMDKTGLLKRRNLSVSAIETMELLTLKEQLLYFARDGSKILPKFKKGISTEEKDAAIEKAWSRMSYDQKLTYCLRPEEIDKRDEDDWAEINAHLGTNAICLQELIDQLGKKRFGRRAIVGDCFCGGGSIPFEAARMGCDVFASDLNPIAGLLTWADLNIAGAFDEEVAKLRNFQQRVYDEVNKQVKEWDIEENEQGDRANSYLYCCETICPECGWKLPLSPSWIIGKGTKTVAILKDNGIDGFDFEIKSGVSDREMIAADQLATIKNGGVYCPHCKPVQSIPISALRMDRRTTMGEVEYGLRKWQKNEFLPQENDVFQERLYCIKYEHSFFDNNGNLKTLRYYTSPTKEDLDREKKVIDLLIERFYKWQEKGYIPNGEIEEGDKTTEPIRTRGWKYWHQLFNPRQLLLHGLFMKKTDEMAMKDNEIVIGLLGLNKFCNWNSKLSRWHPRAGVEKVVDTYSNQALNTIYDYGSRGFEDLYNLWFFNINNNRITVNSKISLEDARVITVNADYWITDPPYADAVNYHELSGFFLAWDKKLLKKAFPKWYTDSKRVLAVNGRDETFNNSMIEIYSNLAKHMPDNGMQIIMFTHQDVSVWADLTLIVWSAGLQVTAAWNIATETEASGLKEGNYVKGTVLLVLRKQTTEETAYIDDIYPDIEDEVKKQIRSMQELDDKEEPNFSDADYILAAYAASLKVLTSYKKIEDIDVQYELTKQRKQGELSPIAQLIDSATKIAYDQLIPAEFDNFIWKSLTSEERLYIKGLELEKHNIYQLSSYQELARGFGVSEYKGFMENTKANNARFKTAMEFGNHNINDDVGFGSSLLRNAFMAIYLADKDGNVQTGKNWLRNEVEDYWNKRERIGEMLKYFATFEHINNMEHWHSGAAIANILKELVNNDGI